MVKVDLITGFLGSGKTTLIRHYARYLMKKGEKIGIIENDHGSVNVDMMLLQDLEKEGAVTEMVVGGDLSCFRRRFRTKLITMGMQNLDRVLVEPSGVYDPDEFFDAMYEDQISRLCQIGSVISVVDTYLDIPLGDQADYLMVSQLSDAGMILLSHITGGEEDQMRCQETMHYINQAMEKFGCSRKFDEHFFQKDETSTPILAKDWRNLTASDYERIESAGYTEYDHVKRQTEQQFQTLYYMNLNLGREALQQAASDLMTQEMYLKEKTAGRIYRVKGFFRDNDKWYELNAAHNGTEIREVEEGQNVLIVIGEGMNADAVDRRFGQRHI